MMSLLLKLILLQIHIKNFVDCISQIYKCEKKKKSFEIWLFFQLSLDVISLTIKFFILIRGDLSNVFN